VSPRRFTVPAGSSEGLSAVVIPEALLEFLRRQLENSHADALIASDGPLGPADLADLDDALTRARAQYAASRDRIAAITARLLRAAAFSAEGLPRAGAQPASVGAGPRPGSRAGWEQVDGIVASPGPLDAAQRAALKKGLPQAETECEAARDRAAAIRARLAGRAVRRPAPCAGWEQVDEILASPGPLDPARRRTLEAALAEAEEKHAAGRSRARAIAARLEADRDRLALRAV